MEGRKTIRLIAGAVFFLVAFGYSSSALAGSLQVRIGNMVFSKDVKTIKDMRFNNIVRQSKDYSCGAASLATIITYYFGRETTEEEVMKGIISNAYGETLDRIKKKGFSLLDLKNFGEVLGYEGAGYRVPAYQLGTLDRPAIVLVNHKGYSHFVVLKGVRNDRVFIADPARGNVAMSLNEFLEIWNGILLVFKNPHGERIQSHALNVKPNRVHKAGIMTRQFDFSFVRGHSEFK